MRACSSGDARSPVGDGNEASVEYSRQPNRLPGGEYLMALSTRLTTAEASASRSPCTAGRPSECRR